MSKNPFPSPDRKRLLMTLLKVMGGAKVLVSFSGGGDSGSIDRATLLNRNNQEISLNNAEFEWEREVGYHDHNGEWKTKTEVATMPLNDILIQITEDALETTDLDWYNNEGGQGTFEIDLTKEPVSIELSVGINYMETDHHSFSFSDEESEEK